MRSTFIWILPESILQPMKFNVAIIQTKNLLWLKVRQNLIGFMSQRTKFGTIIACKNLEGEPQIGKSMRIL